MLPPRLGLPNFPPRPRGAIFSYKKDLVVNRRMPWTEKVVFLGNRKEKARGKAESQQDIFGSEGQYILRKKKKKKLRGTREMLGSSESVG